MPKQITLTIAADGSVTAESHGRQGKKCVEDVALISGLVGESVILSSSLTDEYGLPVKNHEIDLDQEWVQ